MRFAFISRHSPTEGQFRLATEQNIDLVHIGDRDAFGVQPVEIIGHKLGPFDGVVVTHPAAAMRLAKDFSIGVFCNAKRPGSDERPRFEAYRLFVYDLRDYPPAFSED